LSRQKHLLDVNVVFALSDTDHQHHARVMQWLQTPGLDWGLCALSEAGFLRVSINPTVGKLTRAQSTALLASMALHPGYRYWPICVEWASLAAPIQERVFGHQQITDAYLLGLAIKENGLLVTLDKAIKSLAGPKYSSNVLVLE